MGCLACSFFVVAMRARCCWEDKRRYGAEGGRDQEERGIVDGG